MLMLPRHQDATRTLPGLPGRAPREKFGGVSTVLCEAYAHYVHYLSIVDYARVDAGRVDASTEA